MDFLADASKLAIEHWVVTAIAITAACTYFHYIFTYSSLQRIGIKGPTPWPFIGNSLDFLRGKPIHDILSSLAEKYGRIYGLYLLNHPIIVVCDPEYLKAILVKEFDKFHDRYNGTVDIETLPGSDMLPLVGGRKWKNIRSILSPMFTSGKLKQMMFIIKEASDILLTKLEAVSDGSKAINIYEWQQGVALDVIFSSAFGFKSDTQTNAKSRLASMAKKSLKPNPLPLLANMIPLVGKYIGRMLSRRLKVLDPGWMEVALSIIKKRKEMGNTKDLRKDMLTLMLATQNQDAKGYQLTDDQIQAQMLVFMIAGYDTTSNVLALTCYHLAIYPEVQEKLFEEIKIVDTSAFDDIQNLPYLEACINETIRLYPQGFILSRKVTETCTINNTSFKKGMAVFVNAYTIHHDAEYWPNPEAFKPERFLPENKEFIKPFSFLPFGEGPRSCIAMRFAWMEVKTVLIRMLQRYHLVRGPETKVPLKVGPTSSTVIGPEEAVLIRIEKRDFH